MKPTVAILHRTDDSERIAFECDHARTLADHIGGNGDTLRAALRYVLARHTETCRCQPEVIEDLWESMAYMKTTVERDLAAGPPADPGVLALAHQHLDSIRRHGCPCDPCVITTSRQGVIEIHACHREGCKRKMRKGEMRWLDLTAASA